MVESRHARGGFTLFEVLGAVAIMGISSVLLFTVAIQSVRAIGDSQRRIEASLIADERLAELELAAELGQLIELRDEEFEEEPFLIHVEVLDMNELYPATGSIEQAQGLIEYMAAEAAGPFAPFRESNWLLGYLREVHVTVIWIDGASERSVARTAFIYDQQAWDEAEGRSEQAAGEDGEQEDEDDEPEEERS